MAYPDDMGDGGLPSPDELAAMYAPAPTPQPAPPVVQEAGVTGLRGELAPTPATDLPHPDELAASFAPEGPVTSTVAPASAPPQTVKAGVGESFGASQSGFDAGKHAQVVAAGRGVDARISRGQAEVASAFDPLKRGLNAAAQTENQGVIKEIEATQAKMLEQSRLEMDAAKDAAAFADAEKGAFAKSQAEGQLAKADYQRSLAEWSAMAVNPSRLFQSAGKGGQFQMGIAAFVHDFLGAKGIKTSAMDTLNRAIDRDIDAQVQNIGKAGQVTQGFKTLWDMQRAESQSDAEARLRMRGFALETAKHEAAASLGIMDSKLAGAKLQRAQAEITKEQVKNSLAVDAQIQDGKNAVAQREVQRHSAELSASATVRSAKYSYDANMARIASDERGRVTKGGPAPVVVADLTKSGGGVNRWFFKSEFADKPEIIKETTDKLAATAKAVAAMDELMELQARVDGAPPGGKVWNELRGEIARREAALRTDIVATRAYDRSGKALTKAEFDMQASQVPGEGWFTNGETRSIIAQTLRRDVEDANRLVQNRLLDITPDMPQYGTKAAQVQFGEEEGLRAGVWAQGTPAPTRSMVAEKRLGSPDVSEPVENFGKIQRENPELANAWSKYLEARGPLTAEDAKVRGNGSGLIASAADNGVVPSPGNRLPAFNSSIPDKGFTYLYELYQSAQKGDTNAAARVRGVANTSEGLQEGSPYQSPLVDVTPQQRQLERTAEWLLPMLPPAESK